MKKQILATLLVASQAQALMKPASTIKGAPTNDPFIGYQWGLFPSDQSNEKELDSTHNAAKPIVVDPKFNIGWKNLDDKIQRDVIVGIVDSGLHTTHEDLTNRVLKGFNFTVPATKPKPVNPSDSPASAPTDPQAPAPVNPQALILNDDIGHGTHLAGIMAANSNNGIGIAGLSGKIKILPMKVYTKNEGTGQGTAAEKKDKFIDRIIKAIDFSIENKADVLLFSLGWPRAANSEAVQQAFKKAIDAGILIVAAAGNDGHDAQIYPCAYQGVICVAAMNLDGKMSDFSNRGGHVDVAAPGEDILSLWPKVEFMRSDVLGIQGYNFRSGTSQAAPFVAGATAMLRGMFPNETSQQIRARILSSTQPWDSQVASGLLNIEKATQVNPSQFLYASFKGVESAEVDPSTLQFKIPLTIERGNSKALPKVQVQSSRPDTQIIGVQKKSETANSITYEVTGKVADLSAHNKLGYTVDVNGRKFSNQILLQVSIEKSQQRSLPLPVSEPKMITDAGLLTVYNPRNNSDIRYWSSTRQSDGMKISVWTFENGAFTEKSTVLPEADGFIGRFNMVAEDFDMDGKTDYMIAARHNDPADDTKVKELHLYYLDQDLKITHEFNVLNNGANSLPNFQTKAEISFVKITKPGMKPLKVPMYWDVGFIPNEDMNPLYANEPNNRWRRPYYLEPINDKEMVTRTYSNNESARMIREELRVELQKAGKTPALQDVDVLATTVQTPTDARLGRVGLLVSVGRGIESDLYILPISDLNRALPDRKQWTAIPRSSIYIGNNEATEIWNLSKGTIENDLHFQVGYSFIAARSTILKDGKLSDQQFGLSDRTDSIKNISRTYVRGNDRVTFFMTADYIRVQGRWNSQTVNAKNLIYRSTFLPGQLFTQITTPVVVSKDQNPGVLVNNAPIFSNTILTYSLDSRGQVVSPISRTIELPANCSLRNPVINEQNYSSLAFLCKKADGAYELKMIDLN